MIPLGKYFAFKSKLGLNLVASAGARFIALGLSFVQVPLLIRGMGIEIYGLWVILAGWFGMMGCLDFGVGYALQNITAQERSSTRTRSRNAWLSTALAFGSLVATVVLSIAMLVGWLLPRETLTAKLGISAPIGLVEFTFGTAAICSLIVIPIALVGRYAMGLQKNWLTNLGLVVANVLTTAACWFGLHFKLPSSYFVLAAGAQLCLPNLVVIFGLRGSGEISFMLSQVSWRRFRFMFRKGVEFMPTLAAASAMTNVPPVLVGWGGGTAQAAIWNSVSRLCNVFLGFQQTMMQAVWPALTAAFSRSEHASIVAINRNALIAAVVFFALPLALIPVWGPTVFALWVGSAVTPSLMMFAGYGAYAAMQALAQPPAILLNSVGRGLGQGLYGSLCIAAIAAVGLLYSARFGAVGIALTCLICFGVITLPAVWLQAFAVLSSLKPKNE